MSGSPRLIYVDDTSALISYQGKWDDHDGDAYTVNSQWGPPFRNTLHALTGSGSFSFNFTGKYGFNVMTIYVALLSFPQVQVWVL